MTIERTKQLLGSKVSGLTDQEILDFINATGKFLDEVIKQAVTKIDTSKNVEDSLQCKNK